MQHPLAKLLRIPDRKPQGPLPTFEKAHLLLAFLTIAENEPIGRHSLAMQAGLGEGAVRTVLKRLRDGGLAESNASGCHLTLAGRDVRSSLAKKLSPTVTVGGASLTVGAVQVAIAVRGGGDAVKTGIEQRHNAIAAGAAGATTFIMKGPRFTIPGGSEDCERDFPSRAWERLRCHLHPLNGDAVILCGSDSEKTARLGALSAALNLL